MTATDSSPTPRSPITAIAWGICLLAVLAIYLLRLDRAAGMMVDDAWYILLGKSLATGQGYRTISSPGPALLPNYPPGLPFLLSLIFRLNPAFPQNVWMLKSFSIAAMLGTGVLSYSYLTRCRQLPAYLAASMAVAIVTTPAFVFLATSTLMTECLFTFGQLAAVVLIHRSFDVDSETAGRRLTVLAAMMTAAAPFIRSAGLALVIASVLFFLKERRWQRTVLFVGVLLVCLAPWMLYARAHAPNRAERVAHGGPIVYTYGEQFLMRWAGVPAMGYITPRELPARVVTNMVDVLGRDMGAIFVPTFYRGPSESGQEVVSVGGVAGLSAGSMGAAPATMAVSFLFGAVALLGFVTLARERVTMAEVLVPVSLGVTLIWPFWAFRFVLPLAPFLFLYLVAGIRATAAWIGRARPSAAPDGWRTAGLALLCLIGLNLFDHAGYILEAKGVMAGEAVDWPTDAREVDAVMAWINANMGNDGGVASSNSALVYLRTGRKTFLMDDPTAPWSAWKQRGVRYVVQIIPLQLPSPAFGDYKVLYRSPLNRLWVIEI